LRLGLPFAAPDLVLPVESPLVDELVAAAAASGGNGTIAIARQQAVRGSGSAVREAVLGWAAGHESTDSLRAAIEAFRDAVARLRQDDAPLALATAHGTKGLEFDHVAVIGLDAGRFPRGRSVAESAEPERALEEERRLAYVAWTRARRSLTLIYDPGAPSEFLLEAFSARELGLTDRAA
jgi:superfamily I DNA/RNA helicase